MGGVRTEGGEQMRKDLLKLLRAHQRKHGYLPTISDAARELGVAPNAVKWHLAYLRERGQVQYRDGHMARSLRLT